MRRFIHGGAVCFRIGMPMRVGFEVAHEFETMLQVPPGEATSRDPETAASS